MNKTRKAAEIYTHIHTQTGSFCRVFLSIIFSYICVQNSSFASIELDTALQNTYRACVGIDDKLSDYKILAGINTGVQAVGTGLGVGATVVGVVKASKDKEIETLEKKFEKLKKIESEGKNSNNKVSVSDITNAVDKYYDEHKNDTETQQNQLKTEIAKKTKESKKLGNWRTGLIAGATMTNVAGAVLASQSGKNKDLQTMIKNCLENVEKLNMAMGQARFNGEDISEAKEIVSACREYKGVDVSAISKRATGAMAASIVGAATGATGTILSGVANSDQIRNDNTKSGKKKEKDLNTASNVMAGATTVASATSTVFSGTQIAAIKRVANVAAKCEGVLK